MPIQQTSHLARLRRFSRYLKRVSRVPRNLKVDFVIAGTQKGGTTAFYEYLKPHPQICLSSEKEVHFFDIDYYFNPKFILKYYLRHHYYHSFFSPQSQHQIIGEATPEYMYWMDAPRYIWQYNPKMKLIMVLRNPVTRTFSQWNMHRDQDIEHLSFWDALQQEPERIKEVLPFQHRFFAYIERGFYTEQLRRIWRFFPREQTLIFRSEELKREPGEVLRKTYEFLGVDPLPFEEEQVVHARPYVSSMQSRDKEYLQDIFQYEIKALEQMLGWDCSDWLS